MGKEWILTKEERKEVVKLMAEIILKKDIDRWKLRELVRDDLNRQILEKTDFEPIIKEATKSYKRSLGKRLGQQADKTVYELFTNLSQRVFLLETKFEKITQHLKELKEVMTK